MHAERYSHSLRKGDSAAAPIRLGWLQSQLAIHALECAPHPQRTSIKVNIVPMQPQRLAPSKADCEGD